MHAVVVRVNISDSDSAEAVLREQVVPRVSQLPGFVTGYWTRKDDTGLSMIIFQSEEDANRVRDAMPAMVPEGVSMESVEVRQVVANA